MDAADAFRTVEYSRDAWTMEKVPFALLFCLVGLIFVIHLDPRPAGPGIVLALALLVALTVGAIVVLMLLELMFEDHTAAIRVLATVGAVVGIALLPGDFFRPRISGTSSMPAHLLGWMMIIGGVGWITGALFRHVRPTRPILTLTPAGISYHASWLRNLLIPWHAIHGVEDHLEVTMASGYPHRYPGTTVLLISDEFYQQHILVKRRFLGGPSATWDSMFRQKGAVWQMALHNQLFRIDAGDIFEPVKARWEHFRNAPQSTSQPPASQPLVYGVWSVTGSPWQAIRFLGPLVGIGAILLNASGVLPR